MRGRAFLDNRKSNLHHNNPSLLTPMQGITDDLANASTDKMTGYRSTWTRIKENSKSTLRRWLSNTTDIYIHGSTRHT